MLLANIYKERQDFNFLPSLNGVVHKLYFRLISPYATNSFLKNNLKWSDVYDKEWFFKK